MGILTNKVDFTKVGMGALRKYKKTHRVRIKTTNNKVELAEAISKHFAQLPAPDDEAEIIEAFANAVRNHGNQLMMGMITKFI